MKLYRFLTGPDDASFCHRVSEALSAGWELYGAPTLAYDPEQQRMVCGQAVTKNVPYQKYEPGIMLSDY